MAGIFKEIQAKQEKEKEKLKKFEEKEKLRIEQLKASNST